MKRGFIIAIDGPAGSGKSTVAKKVAAALGFLYIDTGAIYRALTLKAIRSKTDMKDEGALIELAGKTDIRLAGERGGRPKVFLDGEDVTDKIRTPELTNSVRHVACIGGVRARMVELQRSLGRANGGVLEGRDIGTVVFPDADRKFYLDASDDVRVERRYKEMRQAGMKVTLEGVKRDVLARDRSDMTRKFGPLRKAKDAVLIDTTGLTIDEVVVKITRYIESAR